MGLTSLFGMGRGGPHRNSHHKYGKWWMYLHTQPKLTSTERKHNKTILEYENLSLRVISTTRL